MAFTKVLVFSSLLFCLCLSVFGIESNEALPEASPEGIEYQSGFDAGYWDSIDGIRNRCENKQDCPSKDLYKRGYKLGYKKGIRELKSRFPAFAGNDIAGEGVRPLIDSPGKTIGSDFNGDGIHDFIVGSPQDDKQAGQAGAAYVIFGSSTLSGTFSVSGIKSPDLTILGKAAEDYLGFSVSSAGDVNGDGIDDIIVGAYKVNIGLTADKGAAYVFFGATNLSGTLALGKTQSPDVTFVGKAASDFLGKGVSSAGDVNGDGFDDILVGADGQDNGYNPSGGAAYVFFGAGDLSGTKDLGGINSPDVTVLGGIGPLPGSGEALGRAVSGAGDLNGDGFDDIIIGRENRSTGGNNTGSALVIFGSSTLSGVYNVAGSVQSPDITIFGKNSSYLGIGVSGAGDVNGDGFDDFVVGARSDSGGKNGGAAYVIFGASNAGGLYDLQNGSVKSPDVTFSAKAASDRLGQSVSNAGDVNDDGFDDLLVGADSNDDGALDSGAAYIFFGSSTLSGLQNLGGGQSADATVLGSDASDALGVSVSGIGDVNADGIPDFIAGANLDDDGGTDAGAAYVVFGSSTLSGTKDTGTSGEDVKLTGVAGDTGDRLGRSVGGGRSNPGP